VTTNEKEKPELSDFLVFQKLCDRAEVEYGVMQDPARSYEVQRDAGVALAQIMQSIVMLRQENAMRVSKAQAETRVREQESAFWAAIDACTHKWMIGTAGGSVCRDCRVPSKLWEARQKQKQEEEDAAREKGAPAA
jgi:hypothetical protein